jgi:hypothetical protein
MKIATLATLSLALALAAIPSNGQFLPHEQLLQSDDGLLDNLYGYQYCPTQGVAQYALCEASICTPTGRMITVNVAGGGTAQFPEAQCTCPILTGQAIADVNGGNMQGNCDSPGPGQVWSLYSPKTQLPQQINNWSTDPADTAVTMQRCPSSSMVGQSFANCFSFACTIDANPPKNSVPTATCYCPLGEDLNGKQVAPNTAIVTPAGQCMEDVCYQYPVGAPFKPWNHRRWKCLHGPA